MFAITPKFESCDAQTKKAIHQAESALISLSEAFKRCEEAVGLIDAQIETLMGRKEQIIKSTDSLETLIDALHPVEPNERIY